mgnify:CR=1 FL=1
MTHNKYCKAADKSPSYYINSETSEKKFKLNENDILLKWQVDFTFNVDGKSERLGYGDCIDAETADKAIKYAINHIAANIKENSDYVIKKLTINKNCIIARYEYWWERGKEHEQKFFGFRATPTYDWDLPF